MKRTTLVLENQRSNVFARSGKFLVKHLPVIASVALAALFSYAAYNKLIIYHTFVQQLSKSPVLHGFENIFGWLVPATEILITALLLVKRTRLIGLWSAFFLMVLFTAYAFVVPHFFRQMTCSCGGIISQLSWKGHFYMNLGFTVLAALALSVYPPRIPKQ